MLHQHNVQQDNKRKLQKPIMTHKISDWILETFLCQYLSFLVCVYIYVCVCAPDSRHHNDTEVEPVPRVPQEGEGPHAEPSGQDLYERLKGVDTCEGVPGGGGDII